MGYKTRMVKEEYFELEIEDILAEVHSFTGKNVRKPGLIVINSVDFERIAIHLANDIFTFNEESERTLFCYGVEVLPSHSVKEGKIKIA